MRQSAEGQQPTDDAARAAAQASIAAVEANISDLGSQIQHRLTQLDSLAERGETSGSFVEFLRREVEQLRGEKAQRMEQLSLLLLRALICW